MLAGCGDPGLGRPADLATWPSWSSARGTGSRRPAAPTVTRPGRP